MFDHAFLMCSFALIILQFSIIKKIQKFLNLVSFTYNREGPYIQLCVTDPVYKIILSVTNLQKSLEYWNKLLGMNILQQSDTSAELGYSDNQVHM